MLSLEQDDLSLGQYENVVVCKEDDFYRLQRGYRSEISYRTSIKAFIIVLN